MKQYLHLSFAVLIYGCSSQAQLENDPADVSKYTIEQFYENENVTSGSISADGSKVLLSSNETGIYNVYEIDIASGEKKRLTSSTKESYFANSYFPGDDRFIYSFDEGGNENYKLHMMSQQGQTKDLTPGDSVRNGFFGWSDDKNALYLMSNKRDPRFMDVYKMPVSSMSEEIPLSEMIYQNNDGANLSLISDDERYFVLTQTVSNTRNDMYLFDASTGERTKLTQYEGDATYNPQYFSSDGSELYYISDEESNYSYLAKRNLTSGEITKVYEESWDIVYAFETENSKYQVIGVNKDAQIKLVITEVATGDRIELPEIENAFIASIDFADNETDALLTVSSSSSPTNYYHYNVESGALTKLTNTLNPDIKETDLVSSEVIRYKSFDGLEIPAVYYQPKMASPENKVPALVWVHGGPGGQSRVGYSALIQYLLNHGYAVLAVNNRGSSGYGKEFYHMDDKNHGDKDLKDCVAGKDFLVGTGVVDPDRIGIIGGSYGGYMVMAALAFEPEAFDVGVNIFGVTNWIRTLKSIPPYW
jgi:dipeptidyl aminopeptidase/acylaminoacyl peptidase